MPDSPVGLIRQARASLRAWLDQSHELVHASFQPRAAMQHISDQITLAAKAMREAPPAVVASQAWRDEIAGYLETLRELRARLGNFEIALRIRHIQLSNARARMDAVRSWSDLARHIG